ncbi:MAG: translation elongation factor 4 [Patescibacteria group bacterium]|nr:translation elongation factor 4 [Patescibacteria group bacterium]
MSNIRNFCIIAHVDHGKSTLADRFLEITHTVEKEKMRAQYLDQMDLERERGITIKMQPVRMIYTLNHTPYTLNLIDTPGHVDFSYEVSRALAAVEGAILLVDATQGVQAQTLANLYQAQKQHLTIIPVINKIDLPNAEVERTKQEIAELLKIKKEEILSVSAKTGAGVENILNTVVEKVALPKDSQTNFSRALIFDSVFDEYRGVIAYVRVIDGEFKTGEKIELMGTKAEGEILELGYFSPKYVKQEKLSAGDIGYIVTGQKDISKCRVGDTITNSTPYTSKPIKPLDGYKEPQPMVFASIYSMDGQINQLREALSKLKLNDASLTYEPESSGIFGFGFRCGFLGLLHLEIIKERLVREYNIDALITTPKVEYKEKRKGMKIIYEEPYVHLEIVSPQGYMGKIMDLAHNHRAIQKDVNYLASRVVLDYEVPLSEIIINFYDELKSVSSGYASMNYEFIGYRYGDLVKMDVLVAGEKIDVLAQIVPRDQLRLKANFIVRRLKDLIPKQMFEVSIQAAMFGKILARENIPALKKDVTGYLYGGDISRKKKLWAKQARGKKKMKKLGRVDIPTDVFIKLLKND